ncbi:hypothetical protein NDI47_17010 [Microcoleus vaginatus GB1-A2]|uniref:hypothetical protein n=1 Tax=Microcoleus vaginatus TaxID=119532 RepID=UPI00168982D2|nr:hypothetical protein [Microcoleus sp. FACHB-61]
MSCKLQLQQEGDRTCASAPAATQNHSKLLKLRKSRPQDKQNRDLLARAVRSGASLVPNSHENVKIKT